MLAALRSADLAPVGLAHAGRPRADPALGVRPRRRGRARAPRRPRPRPRHRRPGRGHRVLGQPAQRLRPPLRALDQRVAALARLPGLPRARAAVLRGPPNLHAALHADAHRPGRPRHPQEEDRVHLRRRPAPADRPDRGRPAVRRVPATSSSRKPTSPPATASSAPPASSPSAPSDPDELERPSPRSSRQRSKRPARPGGCGASQAQAFAAAALPLCAATSEPRCLLGSDPRNRATS